MADTQNEELLGQASQTNLPEKILEQRVGKYAPREVPPGPSAPSPQTVSPFGKMK